MHRFKEKLPDIQGVIPPLGGVPLQRDGGQCLQGGERKEDVIQIAYEKDNSEFSF